MPPPQATLAELAERVGGRVRGEAGVLLRGVATIDDATADTITWAGSAKHARKLAGCKAGAVLGPPGLPATPMPALLVDDVESAIAAVLAAFAAAPARPTTGVHPTALVDPSATIDPTAAVGPHVVVERGSRIGPGSVLHANVYIGAGAEIGRDCEFWPNVFFGDRCAAGDRVILWPSAVIGRDGFGFRFRDGGHRRIPQIGRVVLEDDVEIGSCTCVDRAKCGETRVGAGTKIDNQVQVAHNVRTGRHCVIVAKVGLAGSVKLGHGVVLAGRSGVADNIELGDGTTVGASSTVLGPVPAGSVLFGWWAEERTGMLRQMAATHRLPDLLKELKDLSRRVRELEAATHHREAR